MIGKKLSPVLEEMEATLWEYEAFNGAKPNYTLEGFRASTKIFMSALLSFSRSSRPKELAKKTP